MPAVCGECMEFIDLAEVERALRRGTEYVHTCGRVLVRSTHTQAPTP